MLNQLEQHCWDQQLYRWNMSALPLACPIKWRFWTPSPRTGKWSMYTESIVFGKVWNAFNTSSESRLIGISTGWIDPVVVRDPKGSLSDEIGSIPPSLLTVANANTCLCPSNNSVLNYPGLPNSSNEIFLLRMRKPDAILWYVTIHVLVTIEHLVKYLKYLAWNKE